MPLDKVNTEKVIASLYQRVNDLIEQKYLKYFSTMKKMEEEKTKGSIVGKINSIVNKKRKVVKSKLKTTKKNLILFNINKF